MNSQNRRLVGMALALAIMAVAIHYDKAGVAAITGFMAGMWFSAYMRRWATARGMDIGQSDP